MPKLKVTMISGLILYYIGEELELRSFINSSNSRGGNVTTGYLDEACTQECQLVLSNIEIFQKL